MGTRRQVKPAPADRWGPLPPHAEAGRRDRPVLRGLERGLLVLGIVCLGYYGWVSAETMLYQAYENRELNAILRTDVPPHRAASETRAPGRAVANGSTVGRIDIPRLRVTAVIKAGIDARTLQLAVGHIPGTALPGEAGNVGLAGHRDTFFRRLKDIRGDDEIRVTTPNGIYRYRVEHTNIVAPIEVWVLDSTEQPSLTLITCYPFSYVGSAPQRFVVRAQGVPDSAREAVESHEGTKR